MQPNKNIYGDAYCADFSVKYLTRFIFDTLKKIPNGQICDVGCGDGRMLKTIRDQFLDRFGYFGLDQFENKDDAKSPPIHFQKIDLNCDFSISPVDVVLSLDVIEHVIDTDHFIKQILKCLKPNGVLILSTPNLASFYNRILLLLGYQPLHTEVSWENPAIGRESLYRLMGQKAQPTAGHLRLFTYRALRDFLHYHGLQVEKAFGYSTYTGVLGSISRIFSLCPSLMPGILLIARKIT